MTAKVAKPVLRTILWEDLSEQIHTFLEGISLADLVAKNEVKRISQKQDRKHQIVSENVEDNRILASSL